MPRPRQKALFELGGQWIGRESGKPFLYRYWHDAGTGHSRRASLGTSDLEAAKTALAQIIIKGAPKDADSFLSTVLTVYFEERTDHLPSASPARHAGRLALECWGALITTGKIDAVRNKKFVKDGLAKGHAISYIARNLGVIAAALNHSDIPHRLIYGEAAILDAWPEFKPKPAREIYEPTDEELARILRAKAPQNFRRWVLMSMATAGRPEAILDLTPAARQRAIGLIDLNPAGRRQNKKHRATVREIASLKKWLDEWEVADAKESRARRKKMAPEYCRYAQVDSLDTAIHRLRVRKDINVPLFSSYSIRHRATSIMRADKVPGDQISHQLGHRRVRKSGEARTTRAYGEFDADYLSEAAACLQAWIARVLKLAAQKPTAARTRKAA